MWKSACFLAGTVALLEQADETGLPDFTQMSNRTKIGAV
jgi:hypothetical protein